MKDKPVIVIGDFWTAVVRTLKDELAWEGMHGATDHVTLVQTPQECVGVLNRHFRQP